MPEGDDTNNDINVNVDAQGMERLKGILRNMSESSTKMNEILSKLGESIGEFDKTGSDSINGLKSSIDSATSGMASLMDEVENMDANSMMETMRAGLKQASHAASEFGVKIVEFMRDAGEATGKFGDVLQGTIPVMAALGRQKALEQLPKWFHSMEESVKGVARQAMQASLSLGTMGDAANFEEAGGSVAAFNKSMRSSIVTTRSSQEEVAKVSDSLARYGFGVEGATKKMDAFGKVTKGVQSQITAVNSALLISKATGVDSVKVADMMTEAYMNLKMSQEDAVTMFGHIYDAARTSQLGFETVSDSIRGVAQDLKMWGTSVENITPLFKTFSESLQGIGQEGLTPDMIQGFVSGLQQMTFSARALIGLQGPGAGRGGQTGVLGAGLEMEQALEGGNFEKISENLISTLQQFGGQEILTREEAMESPGQQRQYMIQRQLLGQTMGIQDPQKQEQMLRLLKGVEEGGMAQTEGMESMGELLEAGQATADETTTRIVKANQAVEAAVLGSGEQVLEAIKDTGRGRRLFSMMDEIQNIVEDMAIKGGADPDTITRVLKGDILSMRRDLAKNLEDDRAKPIDERMSDEKREGIEKRIGQIDAMYEGGVASEAGKLSADAKTLAFDSALDDMKSRMKKIQQTPEEKRSMSDVREFIALEETVGMLERTLSPMKPAEERKAGPEEDAVRGERAPERRAGPEEDVVRGERGDTTQQTEISDMAKYYARMAQASREDIVYEPREAPMPPERGGVPELGEDARLSRSMYARFEEIMQRMGAMDEQQVQQRAQKTPEPERRDVELNIKPIITREDGKFVIEFDVETVAKAVRKEMATGHNN